MATPPERLTPSALLSVVVPVFNEEAVLPAFHARLGRVLDRLPLRCKIVYVDDGSVDRSRRIVAALAGTDARIAHIELSRNFGKEIAMTCGLDHARGDTAVIIDADLQDPPQLIGDLVAAWQEGFDVVYARRSAPLRIASHVGLLSALGAFGYAVWIIIATLLFSEPVRGIRA